MFFTLLYGVYSENWRGFKKSHFRSRKYLEMITSIRKIKQEGEMLDEDEYDELLDLLHQIRAKMKK